jgi:uncharacterized protein YybS (DUF2232 family)
MSNQEYEDSSEQSNFSGKIDCSNWVDGDGSEFATPSQLPSVMSQKKLVVTKTKTVVMVETAFLASAASLIWLINYYFPFGPLLKLFFPIPIALIYLRRGSRAAWMSALVSMLLLSVLMGPTRSIVFLIPYGLMGIQLGACWQRQTNWLFSIALGSLIDSIGLFFRFWLFSILLGEDLWIYVITQMTQLTDWFFLKLGILAQPSFLLIQALALLAIVIKNIVYLFAVHLVALMLLDRLGTPITRPPQWVRTLIDY